MAASASASRWPQTSLWLPSVCAAPQQKPQQPRRLPQPLRVARVAAALVAVVAGAVVACGGRAWRRVVMGCGGRVEPPIHSARGARQDTQCPDWHPPPCCPPATLHPPRGANRDERRVEGRPTAPLATTPPPATPSQTRRAYSKAAPTVITPASAAATFSSRPFTPTPHLHLPPHAHHHTTTATSHASFHRHRHLARALSPSAPRPRTTRSEHRVRGCGAGAGGSRWELGARRTAVVVVAAMMVGAILDFGHVGRRRTGIHRKA